MNQSRQSLINQAQWLRKPGSTEKHAVKISSTWIQINPAADPPGSAFPPMAYHASFYCGQDVFMVAHNEPQPMEDIYPDGLLLCPRCYGWLMTQNGLIP